MPYLRRKKGQYANEYISAVFFCGGASRKIRKALKGHSEKLSKLYHSCFLHTFDALSHSEDGAPNGHGYVKDVPLKDPLVWERKYEPDSPAYPLRLLYGYCKATGVIRRLQRDICRRS